MKKINPNIYPKSGYVYRDADGARIAGDSWAGVIARVIEYRKRQGLPFARVHEEVISQACQNNPSICVEDDGSHRRQLKATSIKSRVLKWLSGIRESGNKNELMFVTEALRDARADVCSRCPLDKSMPEGCGSCRAAMKELQNDVIGKRKSDGRFSACPVLGEYLPVSVWIEQQSIPNAELPWECWRKRTL